MAIVNINERTIVQKVKRIILGDERPSFYTRLSVVIAFSLWVYFTIWQTFILMSIVLVDRLKNPEMITTTFNRIGTKYAFMHRWGLDTTRTLMFYSVVVLCLYLISLFGLVLIYKQKKRGFALYLLPYGLSCVFTIVFLGMNYFNEQISFLDKVLFASVWGFMLVNLFVIKQTNKTSKVNKDITS
jgi:hypothetical protein